MLDLEEIYMNDCNTRPKKIISRKGGKKKKI